jgi:MarR family 2-MHQ and catechol resistance regulon transcriptional repressor
MGTAIEGKEKELLNHLESIVHRYVFTQGQQSVDVCRKGELKIVEILGKNGPLMMTEIADRAMLSVSTLTSIMDSLVSKAVVQRERCEEDRRVVRVELTAEGRKVFQQVLDAHLRMVRGMLSSLNQEEQDTLISLFRKIAERIESEKKTVIA